MVDEKIASEGAGHYQCGMDDELIERMQRVLADHERQIQDLSDALNSQWQDIERLKQQLELTQSKLTHIMATADDAGQDQAMTIAEIAARDKPPHY
ncbi:MAG: SlyX family protein [Micavibrio aeruginosavorus]|uniref:SlyX family protein n=1 Tax=Micavibrio aeruginosavorus TaxID=349221 RepID=A0A7T5UGE0_9BACT|nr:MAG: SlyX family protein [Micavibrio aeruginosavorus]